MSDTKRVIIGSETDDTKKIDLQTLGLKTVIPVAIYDSSGAIISSFSLTTTGNSTFGNNSGAVMVARAGTPVPLSSSSVVCKKVTIQALPTNGGNVWIGGSTVSAAGFNGYWMAPTFSITLTVANLNQVFLDSDANACGVSYIYEN